VLATLYEALSLPPAVTTRALSAAGDLVADGDPDGSGDVDGAGVAGAFGEADGDGFRAGDVAPVLLPEDRSCVTT
jgi:hypothetical protein